MADKNNVRIQWVDQTKGIAIILVVLGHVLTNGLSSGIVIQKEFRFLVNFIYSFHMPLFFFISGYLQSIKNYNSVEIVYKKYKQNMLDLAVPYMAFSCLYLLIKVIFGSTSVVLNRVSIVDFVSIFVVPVGEYWYLYALMLFTTISFLLKLLYYVEGRKSIDKIYPLVMVVVLSIVISFCVDGVSSKVGVIRASHQLVYYFLGMLSRFVYDYQLMKYQFSQKRKLWLSIVLLLCLYSIKISLLVDNVVLNLAIALVMIQFFVVFPSKTDSALAEFGRYSLPIYLLHVFIIVLCKMLFQRLGITNEFVYVSLSTVISVIVPFYMYKYIIVSNKWLLFFIKPSSIMDNN